MQNTTDSVCFLMDDNVDPLRSSWCSADTIIQRDKYFPGYHLYTLSSSFDNFRKINIKSEKHKSIQIQISDPVDVWSFTCEKWKKWLVREDGIYYNGIKRIDVNEIQINGRVGPVRINLTDSNITEVFYCTDEEKKYSEDYSEPIWKPLFFIHADGTVFWERYFRKIEFPHTDKLDKNKVQHDIIIPYYKGNLDNPCCIDLYNVTQDFILKTFKRDLEESFDDLQVRVELYAKQKLEKDLHRVGEFDRTFKSKRYKWACWITGDSIDKYFKQFDFTGNQNSMGFLHLKGEKTIQSNRLMASEIYELENTNGNLASVVNVDFDEEGLSGIYRYVHFHKNGTIYWDENCNCKKIEEESVDTDDLPF